MAIWELVRDNRTLFGHALEPGEGPQIPWHDDANQPHSSQVFCISAFGTLRKLRHRHPFVSQLFGQVFPWIPASDADIDWNIALECQDRSLLNEHSTPKPTSIDAILISDRHVICIEGKFREDAQDGFGVCAKAKPGKKRECIGYYGPGSNVKIPDDRSWCQLERWDNRRCPRLYWSLGKAFFRPEVFRQQTPGEACPFSGPNYQLMRNFLFAAAYAEKYRKAEFGMVAICPERVSKRLLEQMDDFRGRILLPEFHPRLHFKSYEDHIAALTTLNAPEVQGLDGFLRDRIDALIPQTA